MTEHRCPCGAPAPAANLCAGCADRTRDRLLRIADLWPELTQALAWRDQPPAGDAPPARLHVPEPGGNATGLTVNAQAMRAMDKAASTVRYIASVMRGEYDDRAKPFNPPSTDGSMDDVPKLARWLGMWHMHYLAVRFPDEGTVEAIRDDVRAAENAVYRATHPSGIHWAPVNLACEDHSTDDEGQRVECGGSMWALVGRDVMPDLVCDVDPEHTIEPKVWERQGWRRRLWQPLHPSGMARLAQRLAR